MLFNKVKYKGKYRVTVYRNLDGDVVEVTLEPC